MRDGQCHSLSPTLLLFVSFQFAASVQLLIVIHILSVILIFRTFNCVSILVSFLTKGGSRLRASHSSSPTLLSLLLSFHFISLHVNCHCHPHLDCQLNLLSTVLGFRFPLSHKGLENMLLISTPTLPYQLLFHHYCHCHCHLSLRVI